MKHDHELFENLKKHLGHLFTKEMGFIKSFDLSVEHFNAEEVLLKFPMSESLHGNMLHGILHGGATATVLDSASGMLAMLATFEKEKDAPMEDQIKRIGRTATIDLRIDYLRPGHGEYFFVKANIVRSGRRITVVDSELRNEKNDLIARGIGTYTVGHA